ncbi:MAG: hypothetical protein H0U74_04400 [Bradymonadaceae bacterium]|nr:hypothetical protein [Lujinxingiaceae bacterium]
MKHLLVLLFLIALAVPMTGCFNNKIITQSDYNPSKNVPDHSMVRLHVLSLVPIGGDINLNQLCPRGTGVVETQLVFPWLGIVTFSQAKVYCARTGASLELDVPAMAMNEN